MVPPVFVVLSCFLKNVFHLIRMCLENGSGIVFVSNRLWKKLFFESFVVLT